MLLVIALQIRQGKRVVIMVLEQRVVFALVLMKKIEVGAQVQMPMTKERLQ